MGDNLYRVGRQAGNAARALDSIYRLGKFGYKAGGYVAKSVRYPKAFGAYLRNDVPRYGLDDYIDLYYNYEGSRQRIQGLGPDQSPRPGPFDKPRSFPQSGGRFARASDVTSVVDTYLRNLPPEAQASVGGARAATILKQKSISNSPFVSPQNYERKPCPVDSVQGMSVRLWWWSYCSS